MSLSFPYWSANNICGFLGARLLKEGVEALNLIFSLVWMLGNDIWWRSITYERYTPKLRVGLLKMLVVPMLYEPYSVYGPRQNWWATLRSSLRESESWTREIYGTNKGDLFTSRISCFKRLRLCSLASSAKAWLLYSSDSEEDDSTTVSWLVARLCCCSCSEEFKLRMLCVLSFIGEVGPVQLCVFNGWTTSPSLPSLLCSFN